MECRLKDLAQKITKGTTPSNIGEGFSDSGVMYFRSELIGKTKYIDRSAGLLYISETVHDRLKRSQIEKNDILFSMAGIYLGKVSLVGEDDYPANTNQAVAIIRLKENACSHDYLYYYMTQKWFNVYVNLRTAQAAQPNINLEQIGKLKINLPNRKVQDEIASILSAYDDLIENNNRRIKILEQMAENLYKEWFVRFRFPGYEQAEFENGIPKGWEIRRFSDNIAKITAGGDRPEVYSPYKSDICTVPIFSNGTDDYGLYGYTNHPKIYEESVTVSARGTVGYVCLREEPYVPIVRLLSLVPVDKEISAKFIYYALKTDCIEGNGTSQQQMTVPMFGRKKILIPDRKLIAKFTAIVDDLFSLRRNHMIANQNLTKQRDMLLPRLMSGKLEV